MKSKSIQVLENGKQYEINCTALTNENEAKINSFLKAWDKLPLQAKTFKRFLNSLKIQYSEIKSAKK